MGPGARLEAGSAKTCRVSLLAPDCSATIRIELASVAQDIAPHSDWASEMKRFGIALALVCCGTNAAKADWQYTKWGMTPQQVVSASKNLRRT